MGRMRIRPELRRALDSDAPDIQHILKTNGLLPDGFAFARVEPNWWVAEYHQEIVGCIQVLPGRPLGHVGFLGVLPGYLNAGVGGYLYILAESLLKNTKGCEGYTYHTANPAVRKQGKKGGAVVFGDPVDLLFKKIKE